MAFCGLYVVLYGNCDVSPKNDGKKRLVKLTPRGIEPRPAVPPEVPHAIH